MPNRRAYLLHKTMSTTTSWSNIAPSIQRETKPEPFPICGAARPTGALRGNGGSILLSRPSRTFGIGEPGDRPLRPLKLTALCSNSVGFECRYSTGTVLGDRLHRRCLYAPHNALQILDDLQAVRRSSNLAATRYDRAPDKSICVLYFSITVRALSLDE